MCINLKKCFESDGRIILNSDVDWQNIICPNNADFDLEKEKAYIYYLERGKKECKEFCDFAQKKTIVKAKDIPDTCKYESKDSIGIKIIKLNNPCKAGVSGMIIPKESEEGQQRHLIISGPLSGCGVAALHRDGTSYFLHAGAPSDTTPTEGTDTIPMDIWNFLAAKTNLNPTDAHIEPSILKEMLEEKKFQGIVVVSKNSAKELREKVNVISRPIHYSNNDPKSVQIYYYEGFCGVTMAVDVEESYAILCQKYNPYAGRCSTDSENKGCCNLL